MVNMNHVDVKMFSIIKEEEKEKLVDKFEKIIKKEPPFEKYCYKSNLEEDGEKKKKKRHIKVHEVEHIFSHKKYNVMKTKENVVISEKGTGRIQIFDRNTMSRPIWMNKRKLLLSKKEILKKKSLIFLHHHPKKIQKI